ncbi:HNH endonuclease [Sulfurimonas sp. MAG313]|nr:HNH endonuclease [Sulfurimonas sp. MAG313]MDF1881298.1 HNH endonuclease [Sulfurimonas sp. MAG313]
MNDFAAAEDGKYLLKNEKYEVLDNIKSSVPWLIKTFCKDRLIKKLGFEDIDMSDLYFPSYAFQYISPGGNSSMSCSITLNVKNLNKLVIYMSDLIKFKNSVAGQRALMTSKLREKIKERDNYICQECSISALTTRNLLLEIDHIIPVSKGGLSSEDNLQTLCWKCNRTKGAKTTGVYA